MTLFNRLAIVAVLVLTNAISGKSQSTEADKYIEVTVTDTIEITPDMLEYTLQLKTDYSRGYDFVAPPVVDPDDTDYNPTNTDYLLEQKRKDEENKAKMKVNEKKLIDLMEKEKMGYELKTRPKTNLYEEDYMYQGSAQNYFILKPKSFQHLEKFLSKIEDEIKYDGYYSRTYSSKQSEAEIRLIEKALLKAKRQAESVAKLSNVSLGMIVQYSDNVNSNPLSSLEDLYSKYAPFMGMRSSSYNQESQKITIEKTIRVRFSIK